MPDHSGIFKVGDSVLFKYQTNGGTWSFLIESFSKSGELARATIDGIIVPAHDKHDLDPFTQNLLENRTYDIPLHELKLRRTEPGDSVMREAYKLKLVMMKEAQKVQVAEALRMYSAATAKRYAHLVVGGAVSLPKYKGIIKSIDTESYYVTLTTDTGDIQVGAWALK
jgi:hypothetical protein